VAQVGSAVGQPIDKHKIDLNNPFTLYIFDLYGAQAKKKTVGTRRSAFCTYFYFFFVFPIQCKALKEVGLK